MNNQNGMSELLERWLPGSLLSQTGFVILENDSSQAVAQFKISPPLLQPFGKLHGGISAFIIESLASIAANSRVKEGCSCVGIELNVSHLNSAQQGTVTAYAHPLRIGSRLQVWEVTLRQEDEIVLCIGRCTLLVQSSRNKEISHGS